LNEVRRIHEEHGENPAFECASVGIGSPPTGMTHIAIQEKKDGKVVDWMEKVTEEQYRK
jgi:hypothetical protein